MKVYSIAALAAVALLWQYTYTALPDRLSPKVQEYSGTLEQSTEQEARKLWEQAIAAKGGREKLLSARDMVISSHAEYTTHLGTRNSIKQGELLVFPNKIWKWEDYRPDVFGLRVEMYNYEARTFYILTPDDPDKEIHHLADYKKWEASGLFNAQVIYFMETKWVRPVPVAVHQGKVSNKMVDIVQAQIKDKRVDFALDSQTHLPIRVIFYEMFGGAETIHYVDLSDYVEVHGINVPQKFTPKNSSVFSSKIQINVDYNEEIFVKPTTIAAGPEAWEVTKR